MKKCLHFYPVGLELRLQLLMYHGCLLLVIPVTSIASTSPDAYCHRWTHKYLPRCRTLTTYQFVFHVASNLYTGTIIIFFISHGKPLSQPNALVFSVQQFTPPTMRDVLPSENKNSNIEGTIPRYERLLDASCPYNMSTTNYAQCIHTHTPYVYIYILYNTLATTRFDIYNRSMLCAQYLTSCACSPPTFKLCTIIAPSCRSRLALIDYLL